MNGPVMRKEEQCEMDGWYLNEIEPWKEEGCVPRPARASACEVEEYA